MLPTKVKTLMLIKMIVGCVINCLKTKKNDETDTASYQGFSISGHISPTTKIDFEGA